MTHGVLIRVETVDPCYWAYRSLSKPVKIRGPEGEVSEQTFLLFLGDQLECDGPYLKIRLTAPAEVAGFMVLLPHHLVALAVSDEQNRTIGFAAE